ncbi:hypothetical protein N9S96_00620 [Flavobacteriales bacterium]|jgi:hypothetical protein|nr:hypothetical protein [Flavobacteriales bacterium]
MNNKIIVLIAALLLVSFLISVKSEDIEKKSKSLIEHVISPVSLNLSVETDIDIFKMHGDYVESGVEKLINNSSINFNASKEIGLDLYVNALDNTSSNSNQLNPVETSSSLDLNTADFISKKVVRNPNIVKSRSFKYSSSDDYTETGKVSKPLVIVPKIEKNVVVENSKPLKSTKKKVDKVSSKKPNVKKKNITKEKVVIKQEIDNNEVTLESEEIITESEEVVTESEEVVTESEVIITESEEVITHINELNNIIFNYTKISGKIPVFKKDSKQLLFKVLKKGVLTEKDVLTIFDENFGSKITRKVINKYIDINITKKDPNFKRVI